MKKEEEYIRIQKEYKGELWIAVETQLLIAEGFEKIELYTYKSLHSNIVYRFVLNGGRGDEYVTRIEVLSEDGVEYSFDKTCIPTCTHEDSPKIKRGMNNSLFELQCDFSSSVLNDYWDCSIKQTSLYKCNKERIDKIISAFRCTGFDFSRKVNAQDALKVGDAFCVIEFQKRTNNARLYKTIQSDKGDTYYVYKAKEGEESVCIFSGLFVKFTLGEDLFCALKISDKYKIY